MSKESYKITVTYEIEYDGEAPKPTVEQLFRWIDRRIITGDSPPLSLEVVEMTDDEIRTTDRRGGMVVSKWGDKSRVLYTNAVRCKTTLVGSE